MLSGKTRHHTLQRYSYISPSIRPLLTAEVRARTLTGRVQINDGGQHLVDGIPFGRPYLRKPSRPSIRIPPRKRQRLDEDTAAGDEEVEPIGLITANGEVLDEADNAGALVNGVASPARHEPPRAGKSSKKVKFREPVVEAEEDSSDEDDDDFVPGGAGSDSDVSMGNDSEDSHDSSSGSEASALDSDSGDSSTSDSDSSSGSDSDGGDDANSRPDERQIPRAPPFQGKNATRSRNHRRRDGAKLKGLKELRILPQEANLEDLRTWRDKNSGEKRQEITEAQKISVGPTPTMKRKRGRARGSSQITASDNINELEQRRQELMAKMDKDNELPVQVPSAPIPVEPAEPTEPAPKRLRPDTSAISRILARQARVIHSHKLTDRR